MKDYNPSILHWLSRIQMAMHCDKDNRVSSLRIGALVVFVGYMKPMW